MKNVFILNFIFWKQAKDHMSCILAEVSKIHWQIENQIKVFIYAN